MSKKYYSLVTDPITRAFLIELSLLLLAAPSLYFSGRFPTWIHALSLALLAGTWLWRRRCLGEWSISITAGGPIFCLFFVMLPIALWAAPPSLRVQYAIPKAYILLWNFCLFWTVVTYSSRSLVVAKLSIIGFCGSGLLIAALAPLGTNWLYKFPGASAILTAIPTPLIGLFQGASSGFHPNQVGGTLLYIFPLLVAMTVYRMVGSRSPRGAEGNQKRSVLPDRLSISSTLFISTLSISTLFMGLCLLATQSRASFVGFAASLMVMCLITWRGGRWLLGLCIICGIVIFASVPIPDIIERLSDAPTVETMGDLEEVQNFRFEVWRQAINGLNDFALTGMGLGTFRKIVWQLYPLDIPIQMAGLPKYDIGHAHNFFLQSGLDFGYIGLCALLILHICVFFAWRKIWRRDGNTGLAIGLLGCLVASTVYGLFDAVAMGAKTNFMFWYLFALIFGLAHHPRKFI